LGVQLRDREADTQQNRADIEEVEVVHGADLARLRAKPRVPVSSSEEEQGSLTSL
jgi:hypothetical protein